MFELVTGINPIRLFWVETDYMIPEKAEQTEMRFSQAINQMLTDDDSSFKTATGFMYCMDED